MKKLSFVTTCMGRLEHLKQTLPTQKHPDCESIVVDWSCPDKCGDWVEEHHPWAKVIRVEGHGEYHRAKARNVGLQAATGEHICNADADMIVHQKFFSILKQLSLESYTVRMPLRIFFEAGYSKYYFERSLIDEKIYTWTNDNGSIQKEKASAFGFIIFPREIALMLGGYDERFDTSCSGGEDVDIRLSLLLNAELKKQLIGDGYMDSIMHSNDKRTEFINDENFQSSRDRATDKLEEKWGSSFLYNDLAYIARKNTI